MSFATLSSLWASVSPYLVLATPYIALGALVLAVTALVLQLMLKRRLARLMLGRNGSLEETLGVLGREIKELQTFRGELEKYLKLAEQRLRGSVSGVGIVRFNPFSGDGSGGNQSFAIAFLDERGSGVVLSSLYARDRVGVYAKPVENGAPLFELSEEEKAALAKATATVAARKKL